MECDPTFFIKQRLAAYAQFNSANVRAATLFGLVGRAIDFGEPQVRRTGPRTGQGRNAIRLDSVKSLEGT